MTTISETSVRRRLELLVTEPGDNEAAYHGKSIPYALGSDITRWCIIRGIRYNDGFATELYGFPELPSITRALNARAIMSNRIPDMQHENEFPYCFWHPDLPSEQTLRELLHRYQSPLMRYQVGRACAAAGYYDLYRSLDILPDVSIAEEARDNKAGGQAIYGLIMRQPLRFAVMDDYNLTLKENPPAGACLNGDTCVRSTLDKKQPAGDFVHSASVRKPVYDITEDRSIDINGIVFETRPVEPDVVRLLYHPLPFDLPTVNKDLLILMAALMGDLDRYCRLRRPRMINGELQCVIRGIYHNTMFAKWWSLQPIQDVDLRKYAYARFIMNNDLSWLTDSTPESCLPNIIHYPHPAAAATYLELVRRRPSMKSRVAYACIRSNMQIPYTRLDPVPDGEIYIAALDQEAFGKDYYIKHVRQKAAESNIDLEELGLSEPTDEEAAENRRMHMVHRLTSVQTPSTGLFREIAPANLGLPMEDLPEFQGCDEYNIFLYVSAAESGFRFPEGQQVVNLTQLYLGNISGRRTRNPRSE